MSQTVDYYQVLCVTPDASFVVVQAAYRALMKAYHPDKNPGHEERVKGINVAYDVLSNSEKRKDYDETRTSEDEINSAFSDNKPNHSDSSEADWQIVTDYYPNVESFFNSLKAISFELSFNFKLILLNTKKFNDAPIIAQNLKFEYLARYFGKDKKIHALAESMIKNRQRKASLQLNRTIKVLGESAESTDVEKKMKSMFPVLYFCFHAELFEQLISKKTTIDDLYIFVTILGGSLNNSGVFKDIFDLTIKNEVFNLGSKESVCEKLLELFPFAEWKASHA